MPLIEINALIEKKPFFDQRVNKSMKRMKNSSKYQEIIIIQQEIY